MWLTVKEVAAHLNIKEKTIYALVGKGVIPHYRVERLVRFKRQEIDQWMETKKARHIKERVDKVVRSVYDGLLEGRPGRLGKEGRNAL